MSTACWPRTMARSDDPAKRVFDPLMAEPAVRRSDSLRAQPYLPNPPAAADARAAISSISTSGTARSPTSSSPRPGRERGRRRYHARACRRSGRCGCSPRTPAGATCASPDGDLPGWVDIIAPSTGVLTTGTFEVAPVDDPCELPPTGGYRGLENQLYRVEIHDAGQPGGTATFKWSRENASVGSRVASMISGGELELATLGRDDVLSFKTGDWVEIIDDVREFAQAPGEMRKVDGGRGDAPASSSRRRCPPPCCPALSRTTPSPRRATCACVAGTSTARSSAPMPAARQSRCRISTPRLDRRHRRAGRGHDAAAGERRHGLASTRPAPRAFKRWRLLGVRGAHRRRLGRAARSRAAARHPPPLCPPRHLGRRRGHRRRLPASLAADRRGPRLQLHGLRHRREPRQRPVHHPGRRKPGARRPAAPSAWGPDSTL